MESVQINEPTKPENISLEEQAEMQEQARMEQEQSQFSQEDTEGAEPQPEGERPEWLPEKFQSPEDLAQAYSELEKQYHSKGEETTEQSVDEDPVPQEYVNSTIQSASDEYAERGHLSDETFKALEASGLSRDLVERYINGVEASSQQQTESLMSEVGGEANYQAMSEWASTALTEDEQEVFNATVESGDNNAALMAIRGLYARYSSDGGKALNLYQGDTVGAGVTPFTSTAQVTEAMQDARYGKDPAYRAHIEKRLSVSSII
jgi:hypothetical protein